MKKFVVPLQAFAALFLCSGMAWMVFVLASINPVPPTVNDLQARNTQDLSFVNMNSTAVALAKQMLAKVAPSPSYSLFLPVTGKESATPVPQVAVTLKPVNTNIVTLTPFHITFTPTLDKKDRPPTDTYTPAPTQTPRPVTATPTSAPSKTKLPTRTSQPPTETSTDIPTNPPITDTPIPPPTPTDLPTDPPPSTEPPPTEPPAPTSTPVPVVVTEPPTQSTP